MVSKSQKITGFFALIGLFIFSSISGDFTNKIGVGSIYSKQEKISINKNILSIAEDYYSSDYDKMYDEFDTPDGDRLRKDNVASALILKYSCLEHRDFISEQAEQFYDYCKYRVEKNRTQGTGINVDPVIVNGVKHEISDSAKKTKDNIKCIPKNIKKAKERKPSKLEIKVKETGKKVLGKWYKTIPRINLFE